jgi:hypothetical protein
MIYIPNGYLYWTFQWLFRNYRPFLGTLKSQRSMRTKINSPLPALIILLILMPACNRHSKSTPETKVQVISGFAKEMVVADTIIYQVQINNPDTGDSWTKKCLGRLHRRALIDSIFSMVYNNRAIAYNHITNERLTQRQVREIETTKGFNRDNIGMIQFTEAWYLNPSKTTMTKEVLSMVLGYNFYTEDGELFGHKPVFRVEMRRSNE